HAAFHLDFQREVERLEDRRHRAGYLWRGGNGKGKPDRITPPISSIFLVFLAAVFGLFGALFLKLGAAKLKTRGLRNLFNMQLILGVGFFLGSSIPFLIGLKHGQLSVLYPMVSVSYICSIFWSKIFLSERITAGKVGALALIVAGIVCIGIGR